MKVCEIFESIQGEGRFAGRSSLFIRTYGCNLRCQHCDTPYSYNSNEYKEYTVEQLLEIIGKSKCSCVVFTGGEPLLYHKELDKLMEMVLDKVLLESRLEFNKTYLLETNGTITDLPYIPIDHITVSPKKHYKKLDKVFEYWSVFNNVDFKFVVGDLDWCWSFDEILEVVNKYNISPQRVWLMPEGHKPHHLSRFDRKIWEFCVKHGFNYSDRLHIRVWDGIRGK